MTKYSMQLALMSIFVYVLAWWKQR